MQPPKRCIVWLRRDLRVADNPALTAALQLGAQVVSSAAGPSPRCRVLPRCLLLRRTALRLTSIAPLTPPLLLLSSRDLRFPQIPVYIWSPEEEGQFQAGRCSRWWLHASLASLEKELAALGSRLLFFRAPEARAVLARLAAAAGAQAVFFNHLYDPISMVRDNEVKATLVALGLVCQSFNADVLREPWDLLDPNAPGQPFSCFEDFWAAHCCAPAPPPPPLPAPAALSPVPEALGGLPLGELGIMSPEEEMSNAQLDFQVGLGARKSG